MSKRWMGRLIHRLPQNAMSRAMGKITASRISRLAIRRYVRHYNIDLSVVEKPLDEYRTLKEFFTRRLKPQARPIVQSLDAVASPVDGTISQMGEITAGTLIQAKGKAYSLDQLLGADAEMAQRFCGGQFITIYLSPRDYHRIHMPVTGRLVQYTYLPGRLYPVNQIGVEQVDQLFARNERLITYINSEMAGCVAVVKVGALFVGSVKVTYNAATTNVKHGQTESKPLHPSPRYDKGEELGWFEFGSTVILLFEPGMVAWAPGIQEGRPILMGQHLATCLQRQLPNGEN